VLKLTKSKNLKKTRQNFKKTSQYKNTRQHSEVSILVIRGPFLGLFSAFSAH